MVADLSATAKGVGGEGAVEDSFDEHLCQPLISCCKKCKVGARFAWKNSDPRLEYEVLRLQKHEPENKVPQFSFYVKKLTIFFVFVTFITAVLVDQLGLYGSLKL